MSRSLHTIIYDWLQELKIPASKNYIRQQLNTHPDYPSLLSITDTLDELGIIGGDPGGCSCSMVEPGSCGVRKNGVTFIMAGHKMMQRLVRIIALGRQEHLIICVVRIANY